MKKLIFIFISLFLSANTLSASMYGGLAYTYGVSTAESDFWNGASGSSPLVILGTRFDRLALELQYRNYTLNNQHTTSLGAYDVDVNNMMFAFGFRFYANPVIHYNFGLVMNDISVEYRTDSSARLSSSAIAGRSMNFYAGGGLHGPLFLNGLEWLVDLNYIHKSIDYGVFTFDIGITYSFWSF